MDKLPALKPLKLEGNLAENWRRWKHGYELFMTATEASKKVSQNSKFYVVTPYWRRHTGSVQHF